MTPDELAEREATVARLEALVEREWAVRADLVALEAFGPLQMVMARINRLSTGETLGAD